MRVESQAEGEDSRHGEKMEVSIHEGTPNHPFKLELSIINNPFWGISILGNHHMVFVFRFRSWESFAFVYLSSQFDCLNDVYTLRHSAAKNAYFKSSPMRLFFSMGGVSHGVCNFWLVGGLGI